MSRISKLIESSLEPEHPLLQAQFTLFFTELLNPDQVWQVFRFQGYKAHTYKLTAMHSATLPALTKTKRLPLELTLDLEYAQTEENRFREWIKDEFSIFEFWSGVTAHVDTRTIKIMPPTNLDVRFRI
jgi:hypothetical protein